MSPQLPTVMLRAQSDERLARAAALGNERAFEAIVERYRRPLHVYARRMLGDSARAEDVVQAGLLGAWRQLQDGNEIRDLRAWLYRVVHNGSINLMKRSSSGDLPLLDGAPLAGPALQDQVEQREAVRAALGEIAALPEQQRTALLGVCVQGRRQRDISEEMGVSEGAVRMLVHRARSTVRTAAAALSPWPLLTRLLHASPSAGLSGGAGGAGLIAGGTAKTVALICTAGVLATAGPSTVHAIAAAVAPASSTTAPAAQLASAAAPSDLAAAPAGTGAGAPLRLSRDARPPAAGTALPQLPLVASDCSAAPAPAPAVPAGGAAQEVVSAPVALPGAPAASVAGSGPATSLPAPAIAQAPAAQAPADDDEVAVTEEAADTSAGEQAIGSDGVPDRYIPPDTAADQQAVTGSDPPDDPATAPDPAASTDTAAADASPSDPAAAPPPPTTPSQTSP